MTNFKSIISIVFLVTTGLNFSSPVFAQSYLNFQLRDALCRQNWAAAIAIIDRMKEAAPSQIRHLNNYRASLVNLRNSRARLAGWPPAAYCAGEIPASTNTPSNNPTNTPSNNPTTSTPNIPNNPPVNIPQFIPATPQSTPQNQSVPLNNQNNQNNTVPTFNQNNLNVGMINPSLPMGMVTEAPNPNCRWVSFTSPQETRFVNGYWNCE